MVVSCLCGYVERPLLPKQGPSALLTVPQSGPCHPWGTKLQRTSGVQNSRGAGPWEPCGKFLSRNCTRYF